MKLEDAIYHAVHDYEGGAASLAPRMGNLSASTLYSMANPRETAHGWSLARFRQLLAFTGDMRPLHAMCEENNGVFIPLGANAASLPDAFQQVCKLSAEFGDVARSFQDAMADGRLTSRERDAIATQIYELITAAAELGKRLDADLEKPAAVLTVAK